LILNGITPEKLIQNS